MALDEGSEQALPASSDGPSRAPSSGSRWVRALMLVLGVVALGFLIDHVGAANVWRTLVEGAVWMPLIIAFDLLFFACEAMAHRAVLGPRRAVIPASRFVRASFLYYCVLAMAPLGRAGAEVARATSFSPWVGGGRAAAAAANIQGAVLLANTFITLPCWIAVALSVGPDHPLAWLLVLNGVVTGIGGSVFLAVTRRSKVGAWLGKRIPRLAKLGSELDEAVVAERGDLLRAALWCCAARVVQVGMYAALLAGVGALVSVGGTLIALGVHLVGAGFGDLVPNQVGILEGAYRIFADAVGLGHDPARAISIALTARIAQIVIAGVGLMVFVLIGREGPAPALATGATTE